MTQAKDVPDLPVLVFVEQHGGIGCNWFANDDGSPMGERSVGHAMPAGTPPKVMLAKMRGLIRRKLVGGCGCGCRGDFKITDLGRQFLATHIPEKAAVEFPGSDRGKTE